MVETTAIRIMQCRIGSERDDEDKAKIINNEENFISSTMSLDMTLDVWLHHNSVSSFPGFGGFFVRSWIVNTYQQSSCQTGGGGGG